MESEINSRIWLGGNIFGYSCDERCSGEIMDKALRVGIRSIDTSSSYSNGLSEKIIGGWINANSDRERWFISSKIGMKTGQSSAGLGKKENISKTVSRSQDNLQTDYLDVLFLHNPDSTTRPEETVSAFVDLYENKIIRAIGFSNVNKEQLKKLSDILAQNSIYNIPIYVQNEFNWATNSPMFWPDLFEGLEKFQIYSVSYGILKQGILAQTFTEYIKLQSRDKNKRANKSQKIKEFLKDENLEQCLEALDINLKTLDSNLFEFSLHYSLVNSDYSIWGVRNLNQLAQLSAPKPEIISDLNIFELMKIVSSYRSKKAFSKFNPLTEKY